MVRDPLKTTLKRGVGRSARGERQRPRGLPARPDQHDHALRAAAAARALGRSACSAASCSATLLAVLSLGLAAAGGSYLWFAPVRRGSAPDVQGRDRDAQKKLDVPRGRHKPAVALVVGYDFRFGDDPTRLALGHADADPGRPDDEVDLDALVPARPDRRRLLPGRGAGRRPHQLGLLALRVEGHARDGAAS